MPKKIEDFSLSELVERKQIQESLNEILLALKEALHKQEYNNAIFYNINGAHTLGLLIHKNLALSEEEKMLEVLQENVLHILRLQNRYQ